MLATPNFHGIRAFFFFLLLTCISAATDAESEDVKLLKYMNVDAYRFSISWPRLIPTGRVKDGVNKAGIGYYHKLINLTVSNGMNPFVTLFHWDVPQGLEDEYFGFLSPRIVKDFHDYANLCFKEFGGNVKHWITLNEPNTFVNGGYVTGSTAPGRCSNFSGNCSAGDSGTEPYIVGHNLMLAHGAAVKLYKEKYQKTQNGKIGITNACHWTVPSNHSKVDIAAASRSIDFSFGWFIHPVVYGEYPRSMRSLVGNRLPNFTKKESNLLKGSYDFLGINYYTAVYAYYVKNSNSPISYSTDSNVGISYEKNGKLIGEQAIIGLTLNRTSFPRGFVFGASGAAYQYEGAYKTYGKGPSIWDTFSHQHPEKIADHSNGDVAIDSYHRYEEDVKLLKYMNVDAYRFSISWPRLIPTGRVKDGVNNAGIEYYHKLINLIVSNGMKPFVTLFHWDVPQGLEDEYFGFLSSRIVKDFHDYANLCFKEFGGNVKHWITLNEPNTFVNGGYVTGSTAPGRCSNFSGNCTAGNSGTEPYIVGHNLMLAHGAAVKLYKEKYQKTQNGKIGITNACLWTVPLNHSKVDIDAASRNIDFSFGWFIHPVVYGEYPKSMRTLVGNRLPNFTKKESNLLKGSYDFLGINYYTAVYAYYVNNSNSPLSYSTDSNVGISYEKNGKLIGEQAASPWLHVYPRGIRDLMLYTKKKYNDPIIYITENGISEFRNDSLSLHEALEDNMRINYHNQHLLFLLKSIIRGVKVEGYFAWSLLDNFEWSDGYTVRFGLNFVDYNNNLTRYPKHSSTWFKKFLT